MKHIFLGVSVLFILGGCGKEVPTQRFKEDQYFPPPPPNQEIAARWVAVSRLGVKDRPHYDAIIEVAVRGIRNSGAKTECELLTYHQRFRADRPWSPLPMAFYSIEFESPDGFEDLNDLFRLTLDFNEKAYDTSHLSTGVTFTRGKVFQSQWRIFPQLTTDKGGDVCTAYATVARSSQVMCRTERCVIRETVAHVDSWRYFTQRNKPEREKDDLSALVLRLEDLGKDNLPEGEAYTVNVPEFR